MSTVVIVYRMQVRSLWNAVRYDSRMRVGLLVGFAFSGMIGFWSAGQLAIRLHEWQVQGSGAVEAGLWSICLLTWSGMSGLTILSGLQRAWGDDEALLLFALPFTPAAHFRVLYGSLFIENLWNWLLLEVGVTGYVLVSVLGWHGVIWLVLLQLGVAVVVVCSLVVMFFVIERWKGEASLPTPHPNHPIDSNKMGKGGC